MLIKEYRIALPMSLQEYQVAQLYMIQKKSREESSGEGSGVEILENRPYTDGPGGCGQFTHKVYHVGSHIPSWFRALLPKAALQVAEESWNAYPYTRTRYTCPFVEKFSIDIETYYRPDSGDQDNVFNLISAERRQRIVDLVDIVRDPIAQTEYKANEDPKLFRSVKTSRGPLTESWIEERRGPSEHTLVMCAYKLCKVEFRYWGMQSKIEHFIHDIGLRRVMLRAHRQAWCWQDEWCDLTMQDIRELEEETARTLAQRMGRFSEDAGGAIGGGRGSGQGPGGAEGPRRLSDSVDGKDVDEDGLPKQWPMSLRSSHSSQHAGAVAHQALSEWRMQNIARDSDNSSGDEFFDAHEDFSDTDEVFSKLMTKWSSNEFIDKAGMVGESEGETPPVTPGLDPDHPLSSTDPRTMSESVSSENISQSCKIHVLTLVLHGGNILDPGPGDPDSKSSDLSTLESVFDTVTSVHFPEALGHMASRLVPCPPVCAEALSLISKLSPSSYDDDNPSSTQDQIPLAALPLLATASAQYRDLVAGVVTRGNQAYSQFLKSEEGANFKGQVCIIGDCVGGILAFDALCNISTVESQHGSRRGSMNTDRLSPEILIDTDPLTSPGLQGTRQLSRSYNELTMGDAIHPQGQTHRKHSNSSTSDIDSVKQHSFLTKLQANVLRAEPCVDRQSSSSIGLLDGTERFDFEISDLFLFGCPLGLVLALRKMVAPSLDLSQFRPACQHVYNLFHPADPLACRLEPLLSRNFHLLPPCNVPRYQKFPLGDGSSSLLVDTLQSFTSIFSGVPEPMSTTTLTPAIGDLWRSCQQNTGLEDKGAQAGGPMTCDAARVIESWWGCKRVDFALYCPDALTAFPTAALPPLFHASYWESTDVVAFILRQVITQQNVELEQVGMETSEFCPPVPHEKWLRKRTQVKIRNVAANHRASDAVVVVGSPQVLSGRFTYGPLDVVTLTGEIVDVYIMTKPPSGKWIHFGTETTNSSGRITCSIGQEKQLPLGMYPVRMFVRGDHTFADCYLSVLPKRTECVVFSIDGSFAASVSIMGSDPKVRAGAVDVVRHWQVCGYLIVYVSGRPDMQKQKVVAWLSQHNFPHGIVSFCDGLVHDPLRQKMAFLQSLVQEAEMKIEAAYGSTKDISVYSLLRIRPQQIYIVGRSSKKWVNQCQFLTEGYVAHLAQLESRSSPPINAWASPLGKGSFGGSGRGHFAHQTCPLPRSSTCPRAAVPSPAGGCRSDAGGGVSGGSGGGGERGHKPRNVSLRFNSAP